jgi:RNA polymerase sigma factor (sigma-70 family)
VAQDLQTLVSELAASHGPQLRRFLLARVRNTADVPDIVQDVYLRMLRIPHVESIRSPEAYLFTVAQHVLQQYTLRQSQIPPLIDLAGMLEPPVATPDADPVLEVNAQQCLEDLQQALDLFAPKVRATFMLHRRDGLSFDEIGTKLGISRPMVKKHLVKALMQFRQALETAGRTQTCNQKPR